MNRSSRTSRWSKILVIFIALPLHIAGASEGDKPPAPTGKVSGLNVKGFSSLLKPGDDFFRYVNDRWLRETEIPADRSNYGNFMILSDRAQEQARELIQETSQNQDNIPGSNAQKVGDFFSSYMDIERRDKLGSTPIQFLLEKVRGLNDKNQIGALMAELDREGVSLPLAFYAEPDARSSSEYAIYLTQSGITLPDRDYYLVDNARNLELREKFRSYVTQLLKGVGYIEAAEADSQVYKVEAELAKHQWTNVQNRNPVKTYNKADGESLKHMFKTFPWRDFSQACGLSEAPFVIVQQPGFFEGLDQMFGQITLQEWKSYLAFNIADSFAPYLSEPIERMYFEFHDHAISGIDEQLPRWKRGVQLTNRVLGEVVGQIYVARHFAPLAKTRMAELVQNLRKAFAQRISRLDWMTPQTKQKALEKLGKFDAKIGYPDKWKDYSLLLIDEHDLVGNMRQYASWETQRNLDKIGTPVDRTEWGMTPQTVNAYYDPTRNEIVFPAAILQPPFFNTEADDAVNYGGIGSVIGHELSHGFDDSGSQYDGDGNLSNWWTDEDREEFDKRASLLVEQYHNYKPFEDASVNGKLTLGENIGDLGGINIAHSAYEMSLEGKPAPILDGLTGDQRFFLGFGQIWARKYRDSELRRRLLVDPHSPSNYRVNGILRHIDAFHDAFNVEAGQEMYADKAARIRIW